MSITRAAIYCRYSSDNQKESSLDDQARNCQRRADAEGWQVVARFADAAISGTDSNRPQYLAMQEAAKRGEFEVLLIDDMSRLTRDGMEQERIYRSLEFMGLRIVSATDGYDSKNESRKIHRLFKGAMNEMFIEDLAKRVHRGHTGQAIKGYWQGGRPYGYRLVPDMRPNRHGDVESAGTLLEVNPEQAAIVREMFERSAAGESNGTIAADLNSRRIPSPGSTWNRTTRRCAGWLASAVRVILRNPLYTGRQRWNASQYVKNPDTGKHERRKRPAAEWQVTHNEQLRIVNEQLFERVQKRFTQRDTPMRGGARHVLSGILQCAECGRNIIPANDRSYVCSSYKNGGRDLCGNDAQFRIDVAEAVVLADVREKLRDPKRVARMAKLMEAEFARRLAAAVRGKSPQALQELDGRIDRLRQRLRSGDPDMAPDELQAALDRAMQKRQELAESLPEAKASARVKALLPKAAEAYLRQIDQGLGGDPRAVMRARGVLRSLIGPVKVENSRTEGPVAKFLYRDAAVLRNAGVVNDGRGERI